MTLVFNITEGDVEGTDVGGLVVAVVADTPKVMTEGNWSPSQLARILDRSGPLPAVWASARRSH